MAMVASPTAANFKPRRVIGGGSQHVARSIWSKGLRNCWFDFCLSEGFTFCFFFFLFSFFMVGKAKYIFLFFESYLFFFRNFTFGGRFCRLVIFLWGRTLPPTFFFLSSSYLIILLLYKKQRNHYLIQIKTIINSKFYGSNNFRIITTEIKIKIKIKPCDEEKFSLKGTIMT